jgi:hypothetical protein
MIAIDSGGPTPNPFKSPGRIPPSVHIPIASFCRRCSSRLEPGAGRLLSSNRARAPCRSQTCSVSRFFFPLSENIVMRANLHPSPRSCSFSPLSPRPRSLCRKGAAKPFARPRPSWPVLNRPANARQTSKPIWRGPSPWSSALKLSRPTFLCLKRISRRRTFKARRQEPGTACRWAIS